MGLTLEQVEARLSEAGAAPPPRPRQDFVDALESRLLAQAAGGGNPAVLPLVSRPAGLVRTRRAVLALAAVGAVLTGVVTAPSGEEASGRVRTVDLGTATTPEPVSPVPAPDPVAEAVVPPPAPAPTPAVTAVPTAPRRRPPAEPRRKSAPVSAAPAPTTSMAPPTTTPAAPRSDTGPAPEPLPPNTTAPPPPAPAPESLALRCHAATTAGGQQVTCEWSESTSPQFAGYRLMRKTASEAIVKVFATRDRAARSYVDTAVEQGARYGYVVEAKDTSGRVIARSGVISVNCCSA